MKDKLDTIEANLRILIIEIEELKCPQEINYNLFRKIEKINEKLDEVESLIREIDAMEEF